MNKGRVFDKVQKNPRDVRFSDLVALVERFGYTLERITGSHHIYAHRDVPRPLNVQPDRHGKAKAYQVRQFLRDVREYGLEMEDVE